MHEKNQGGSGHEKQLLITGYWCCATEKNKSEFTCTFANIMLYDFF